MHCQGTLSLQLSPYSSAVSLHLSWYCRANSYKYLCTSLQKEGVLHLTDDLLGGSNPPPTTNPVGERLLTAGKRVPHTLDYAFGRSFFTVVLACGILVT